MRLEPLRVSHAEGLAAAAAEDRSSYDWTVVPDGVQAARAYVEELVADRDAARAIPFAQVRQHDGRVVGATRYLSLRTLAETHSLFAVEIGGTWLAASAQRSGINTEAKLLLLRHAFDVWRVARVDLQTDARNARSRAAIQSIGATFEGVLRKSQRSYAPGEEGRLRDVAMHSVLLEEWPMVRAHLEAAVIRAHP